MYGLYSRAASNQERPMMARVRYINMESSEIVGPLKLSRIDYNVKYLNLGHCDAGPGVLQKLISYCQSIQKLSLCNLGLNSNAVKSLKS